MKKELPKISIRQHYIYKPLHELFNDSGLDDFEPSKNKWFGLYQKLWLWTNRLVWREGTRLRKKYGNTTYRSR